MSDANVLYIFVEESGGSVVSLEDLKEWLSLVDEVLQIKVQYDASEKKNCFFVQLKHASAAEQCVYYLSNTKLKGCLIDVRSPVYIRGGDNDTTNDDRIRNGNSNNAASKRVKLEKDSDAIGNVTSSHYLPHNLDVPVELSLDGELVNRLPFVAGANKEGKEMVEQLKTLQERLVCLMRRTSELEKAANEQNSCTTVAMNAQKGDKPNPTPVSPQSARYQNQVPFSHDAYTASRIVTFITTTFGPLSSVFQTELYGNEYLLAIEFFFPTDAEQFNRAREPPHDHAILGHEWCPVERDRLCVQWHTSAIKGRVVASVVSS